MSYQSWSVVYGEVPSAAKWGILGANDASFNDGTGIFGLYKNLLTVDSNPYKFRVSRNAALNTGNGANAIVSFDTEQYDTNNNVSSGTYTAPVSGFYQFNWRVKTITSGAEQFNSSLFVNGAAYSAGSNNVATSQHISSQGSDVIPLSATNTVAIYTFNTAARALEVGATACYFSGFLVSRT